jgi:hypothetical protein
MKNDVTKVIHCGQENAQRLEREATELEQLAQDLDGLEAIEFVRDCLIRQLDQYPPEHREMIEEILTAPDKE